MMSLHVRFALIVGCLVAGVVEDAVGAFDPCAGYDCGSLACQVANAGVCSESSPDSCDLVCVPRICLRMRLYCQTCPNKGYKMLSNGCQSADCGCIAPRVTTAASTTENVPSTTVAGTSEPAVETTTPAQQSTTAETGVANMTTVAQQNTTAGKFTVEETTIAEVATSSTEMTPIATTKSANNSADSPCRDVTCPAGYECVVIKSGRRPHKRIIRFPILGRYWCPAGFRCRSHHTYQYFYCQPTDGESRSSSQDSDSGDSKCKPQTCPMFCPDGCKTDDDGCPLGQCTRRLCRNEKGRRLCARGQICLRTPPPRNCYDRNCHWTDSCVAKDDKNGTSHKGSTSGGRRSVSIHIPPLGHFGFGSMEVSWNKRSSTDTDPDKKLTFCPLDDTTSSRKALQRIVNRVRSVAQTSCFVDADCKTDEKCCLGIVQALSGGRRVGTTCQRPSDKAPTIKRLKDFVTAALRG